MHLITPLKARMHDLSNVLHGDGYLYIGLRSF